MYHTVTLPYTKQFQLEEMVLCRWKNLHESLFLSLFVTFVVSCTFGSIKYKMCIKSYISHPRNSARTFDFK